MKPLKCYQIRESDVIKSGVANVLTPEFICECRAKEFIYGNHLNWSHYVGILRDADSVVIINPKYSNTDFDTIFKYAIVPKKYRTETYMTGLLELFAYMPSRKGRPRMLDCEDEDLDVVTGIIKSFRRSVSRTSMTKESKEIRTIIKKLNKCFKGKDLNTFPQLVIDMAKLFELYIYGIIVRCVPNDNVLYQEKHNHLIPDYIVPGDRDSYGFIADAKYLSAATKVRDNDLRKMEKYAKDSYFRKLTCYESEKPACYFFCASRNGLPVETIINASTWKEISKKMHGCGDNPFYRISVAIPRRCRNRLQHP